MSLVCHSQDLLRAQRRERDDEITANSGPDSRSPRAGMQSLSRVSSQSTQHSVIAQPTESTLQSERGDAEKQMAVEEASRFLQNLSPRPQSTSMTDLGRNERSQVSGSHQFTNIPTTNTSKHGAILSRDYGRQRRLFTPSISHEEPEGYRKRSDGPQSVPYLVKELQKSFAKRPQQGLLESSTLQGKRNRSPDITDSERRVRPRSAPSQSSSAGNVFTTSGFRVQLRQPLRHTVPITRTPSGCLSIESLPVRPGQLQVRPPNLEVPIELSHANDIVNDRKRDRPSDVSEVYAVLRRFQHSLDHYYGGWRSRRSTTQEMALDDLVKTIQARGDRRDYASQARNIWIDDSGSLKHIMESYIQQLTNIATSLLQAVEANIFMETHGHKKLPNRIVRGPMLPWFKMLEEDHWTQAMVILDCQIAIKRMHECFEAHNYEYNNLRSRTKQLILECLPRSIERRQRDLLEVLLPRLPVLWPNQPAFPILYTHPSDMRFDKSPLQDSLTEGPRIRRI